jgi:transposase
MASSLAPVGRIGPKGKVERPFRYIREDFFLGASFRNLDDLNAQLMKRCQTVNRTPPVVAPWCPLCRSR